MFASFLQSAELISRDERVSLQAEALQMRAASELATRYAYRVLDRGQFRGPSKQWGSAGTPPGLREFHRGKSVEALSELVQTRLRPTVCSYFYYRHGDFIALHRDQPVCQIVMLVWLDGPGGSLHVHPELKDEKPETLIEHAMAHAGHPPGGQRVDVRDGPVVLAGHTIPHHRPPHKYEDELVVAGLCFASDRPVTGGPRERP